MLDTIYNFYSIPSDIEVYDEIYKKMKFVYLKGYQIRIYNSDKELKYTKKANSFRNPKFFLSESDDKIIPINNNVIDIRSVSCAGKSTLCNLFINDGYNFLGQDDYLCNDTDKYKKMIDTDVYNNMKQNLHFDDIVFNTIDDNKKYVCDFLFNVNLDYDYYSILLVPSFERLIKNIRNRKDSNLTNSLESMSDLLMVDNKNGILSISFGIIKNLLEKNLKYLFNNERHIDAYTYYLLSDYEIEDKKTYKLVVKDKLNYCMILYVDKESPEKIYELIKKNMK